MATEIASECPKCQSNEIAEGEARSMVTCAACRLYHDIWTRLLPA